MPDTNREKSLDTASQTQEAPLGGPHQIGSGPRVTHLRSVELRVPDLRACGLFYQHVWGLEELATVGGVMYLRGTGTEHHLLALRQDRSAALHAIHLGARDKWAVDALHARAVAAGARVVSAPHELPKVAGGGYGFPVMTPDGHTLVISSDVMRHEMACNDRTRPERLSHVALNSSDPDREGRFFQEVLGFRNSDRTFMVDYFLRCSSDHHSIAVGKAETVSLNHVAYEMVNFDGLMRAAGRMQTSGYPIEWGVGRHGPGNNIFAYFFDPNGTVIEYSTEFDQVDDATHVPNTPEYWRRLADGKPERWGMAKPSPRLMEAWSGTTIRPLANTKPEGRSARPA